MQAINLLPKDLTPKKAVLKLSNTLRKVNIIGYSLVLITMIVMVGVSYLISRQINSSQTRQEQLKSTIVTYEQTEQKLIIVKDRLAKADTVLNKSSAFPEVENFQELLLLFPEGVRFEQAGLSTTGTEVNIQVQSSTSLVKLFATLISSKLYRHIELTGFNFNNAKGYWVSFKLIS